MTTALVVLLGVVVAVLAVLVAGLLRSHAVILRRLHELGAGLDEDAPAARPRRDNGTGAGAPAADAPIGRDAADIVGVDPRGGATAIRIAGAGHGTVLAFLSSNCLTCVTFWEELRDPSSVFRPEGSRIVIVAKSPADESPRAIADLAPPGVTTVLSSEAWADYDVPGSPYVIYVDGPSGRVAGEGTGGSWAQVGRLLAQATGDLAFAAGPTARRRKARGDAEREQDIDGALLAAGVLPDDERLYRSLDEEARP